MIRANGRSSGRIIAWVTRDRRWTNAPQRFYRELTRCPALVNGPTAAARAKLGRPFIPQHAGLAEICIGPFLSMLLHLPPIPPPLLQSVGNR